MESATDGIHQKFWHFLGARPGELGQPRRGQFRHAHWNGKITVDFREQAGIYVLYAGSDIPSLRVVYVGQAGRENDSLFARLREHTDDHLWEQLVVLLVVRRVRGRQGRYPCPYEY